MSEWEPTSREDELLVAYHDDAGGRIYTEVPAPWSGGHNTWPEGFSNRYIDGIRLSHHSADRITSFANNGTEVRQTVEGTDVEVIEIKRQLNRPVIGQAIAGCDLFEAEYRPSSVRGVVICESTDSALEWVCEQRGIRIEVVDRNDLSS